MYQHLKISKQLYYYHLKPKNSIKIKKHLEPQIKNRILAIYKSSDINKKGKMQASKKITIEYNSQIATNSSKPLSAYQILKIMKYLNFESNYHKKQNKQQKQTKSNNGRYADNILNRKYNATINSVITSDLTDASTSSAMHYVCFIVDLWNKETA